MFENCEVKVFNKNFKDDLVEIASGIVWDFNSPDLIITNSQRVLEHNIDKEITVKIIDLSRGESVYETILEEITPEHIFLKVINFLGTFQRRQETRVFIEQPISTKTVVLEMGIEKKLDKDIPLVITNISASGLSMNSPLDLPNGISSLVLNLNFISLGLVANAKIIRKHKTQNGFQYGCSLNGINEKEREDIRSFVFKKQSEMIRNKKKIRKI